MNTRIYFDSFFLLLFVVLGCSAEQRQDTHHITNVPIGSPPESLPDFSGTGGSVAPTVNALECAPKESEQACHCPDGTPSGTQKCDERGRLWPCDGCKNPDLEFSDDLCPELQQLQECEARSYVSQKLTSSILFVVDRSGSMMCNTPTDGQSSRDCEEHATRAFTDKPSKWEITIQALKESFTSLEGKDASAGLMFFSNDAVCGVHSDLSQGGVPIDIIGTSHNALLFNALDNQTPAGGTPLVGATILAYAHLHQEAGGNCPDPPCGAPGNRFVVLITDGADSCPDPTFDGAPCGKGGAPCTQYLLETEVGKAVNVNIRTFVIGAPGSELARGFLSDLAFRGGTGNNAGNCNHGDPNGTTGDCHFDMTDTQNFADDLSQALDDISGSAIGSEFAVPDVPDANPEKVNVQYKLPGQEPVCIPKDDSASCEQGANGWQFALNPDGSNNLSKVVLCGDYRAMVENNASIRIDVILGCISIVIV